MELVFFIWIAGSVVVSVWAVYHFKKRWFAWFLISLALSPVFGAIVLYIIGTKDKHIGG